MCFDLLRRMPRWLLLPVISATAYGGTLYFTEFEEFGSGDNQWAGSNGWSSNDTTSGAQGIIQNPVADLPLGKTAYLGYEQPAGRLTTVFKPINHDPLTSGLPVITFESLLGVQDSTNGRRDRFHISFYNIDGDFLASITFDNTSSTIKRDDGVAITDTGLTFLRGEPLLGLAALQILRVTINLPANTWSAEIDGIPIFEGYTFTATGGTRSLGAVAAEWEVAAATAADAGNNWLLVADWLVAAAPPDPFEILSITRPSAGEAVLVWPGHSGFDYQVVYSADLVNWSSALPGSSFQNVASDGIMSFNDTSVPARRFYRVRRSPTR